MSRCLLKLNEIPENQEWTSAKIKEAYHAIPHTICQIAKRLVTGGLEAALGRKEQVNRYKKVDGRVEAHIIAAACSEAPEGRERWTLQMIEDELVRLGGHIFRLAGKYNSTRPHQGAAWNSIAHGRSMRDQRRNPNGFQDF